MHCTLHPVFLRVVLMLQPRVVSMDGAAACGPDRSPGRRAGTPPGSDALYRSIDAIRPRHAEHITCLGPQSDIMAGRIIPLPEGQTVDLIPAPEVDRRVREN